MRPKHIIALYVHSCEMPAEDDNTDGTMNRAMRNGSMLCTIVHCEGQPQSA